MKNEKILVIGLILAAPAFVVSINAEAAEGAALPSIFAATVEDTAKAENIRLAVSPSVDESNLNSKIVCAEGMVRIRLEGVSNRGKELEQLSVPENGLFEAIRIVEKNPTTSVVQMFPRRNPEGTCARTGVTVVSGEIVISTLFSDAELERIKAAKERDRLVKEQALIAISNKAKAAKAEQKTPTAAVEDKAANIDIADISDKTDKVAIGSLVFKKDAADSGSDRPAPMSADTLLSNPKLLVGFGFAAVIAGLALYLKKRKPMLKTDFDKIAIISTQRLGLKQQLMLVSVLGTRFLLAVSDKTVSSLGIVTGDELVRPRKILPPYQPEEPAVNAQQSALESLIGEASRRAAKAGMPMERDRADSFDSELRRALDNTALGEEKPRATGRVDTASNAAGLVALARMRANLKKEAQKSQVFEA
jgi:flagellar biogenesis protein FliO